MPKILAGLILMTAAAQAWGASGPVTVFSSAGLAYSTNPIVDLQTFITPQTAASKLAVQVSYSSAVFANQTFTTGTESTGSVTINGTALLATAATDQITVPATALILGAPATNQITIVSTTGLAGITGSASIYILSNTNIINSSPTISINGSYNFTFYVNVDTDPTNSAANLATAINAAKIPFTAQVTNSTGVIVACVSSGTFCNSYYIRSSSPTAISTGAFSGGYNAEVIQIITPTQTNRYTYGDSWASTDTVTHAATTLVNDINSKSFITASSVGGVVYATATVYGTIGNAYTITSSSPAVVSLSSSSFLGGLNRALVNSTISVNGMLYQNGDGWTDSSNLSTGTAASIAALINGSTGLTATAITAPGVLATGSISVLLNTAPLGSVLTINGNNSINLYNGVQWTTGATSSNTASSIATAINLYTTQTGIVANNPGTTSVVFTSASIAGVAGNSFSITSSTPTAVSSTTFTNGTNNTYGSEVFSTASVSGLAGNSITLSASAPFTVAKPNYSGGQDAVTFVINTTTFTAGVSYSTGAATTTDATNLATAITASSNTLHVLAHASGSVVFTTSTIVGTAINYGLSTNNAQQFTLSNPTMTGGTNSAITLNSGIINLPAHGFTTDLQVLYSGTPAIGGLTTGTTYFIVVVDSNDIGVSSTSAVALTGNYITITSTSSQQTANTYTLAPLAFNLGPSSALWQGSNDGSNWATFSTTQGNITVSSQTFTAAYPNTTVIQDWGPVDYGYLRYVITGPTQGGVNLKVILNAKD